MATLGLELLWSNIREQLTCKGDAAVAIIHWILLKNSLKCVGETKKDENKPGSEFLPKGWNQNKEVYSLHYTDEKDDFIIKIVEANDLLLLNILNDTTDVIGSITVKISNVNDDYKNYSSDLFKSLDKLIKDIETEVISKIKSKPKTEPQKKSNAASLHMATGHRPIDAYYPSWERRFEDPLSVGRADLDPLATGSGGGMLMNPRGFPNLGGLPRRPGNLPRGAIPPRARFDPIGPFPEAGSFPDFSRNNPDHLPPPGYDDMFM